VATPVREPCLAAFLRSQDPNLENFNRGDQYLERDQPRPCSSADSGRSGQAGDSGARSVPFEINTIGLLAMESPRGIWGMKRILPSRNLIADSIELAVEANVLMRWSSWLPAIKSFRLAGWRRPVWIFRRSWSRRAHDARAVSGGKSGFARCRGRVRPAPRGESSRVISPKTTMHLPRSGFLPMMAPPIHECWPKSGNVSAGVAERPTAVDSQKRLRWPRKAASRFYAVGRRPPASPDHAPRVDQCHQPPVWLWGAPRTWCSPPGFGQGMNTPFSLEPLTRSPPYPFLCNVRPRGSPLLGLGEAGGVPAVLGEIAIFWPQRPHGLRENPWRKYCGARSRNPEVIFTRENHWGGKGDLPFSPGTLAPEERWSSNRRSRRDDGAYRLPPGFLKARKRREGCWTVSSSRRSDRDPLRGSQRGRACARCWALPPPLSAWARRIRLARHDGDFPLTGVPASAISSRRPRKEAHRLIQKRRTGFKIDIPQRQLNILVSSAELEQRQKNLVCPPLKIIVGISRLLRASQQCGFGVACKVLLSHACLPVPRSGDTARGKSLTKRPDSQRSGWWWASFSRKRSEVKNQYESIINVINRIQRYRRQGKFSGRPEPGPGYSYDAANIRYLSDLVVYPYRRADIRNFKIGQRSRSRWFPAGGYRITGGTCAVSKKKNKV